MKNSIKILAVIAMFGFAGSAMAQSNTATGTAGATIIQPITISPSGSLQFGNFLAGTGTVTVDNTGALSYSNGAMNPGPVDHGNPSAQGFNVAGSGTLQFTIANSTVTYGVSPAWGSMTLTINAPSGGSPQNLVGGAKSFTEGGVISCPSGSQAVGTYSATWSVTVNYD